MAKNFPLQVTLSALDRISGPLGKVRGGIERTFAPLGRMQRELAKTSRALGLAKLQSALGGVGRSLGGVATAASRAFFQVSALATLAAGSGLALVRAFAKAGDTIAKTADKLGLGVEAFQELAFAADRSGVDQEAFAKSVQAMTKTVGEAKLGLGTLYGLLKDNAPDLLAQIIATDSTERSFALLIQTLEGIEDVSVRNAIAFAAFGRGGVALTNLAKGGAAGLEALRVKARALGLVMTDDAARGAEVFTDAQTDLFASLAGLRNLIGAALVPELTRLTDKLTDLVVRQGPRIRAFAAEFAAQLPDRLRMIRQGLFDLAAEFRPVLRVGEALIDRFGVVNVGAAALAAVIGGPLVLAVAGLTSSVLTLTAAILTTPIGWIMAGLVAAVATGWFFWSNWKKIAGLVADYFEFMWRPARKLLTVLERIGAFTGVPAWIKDLVRDADLKVSGKIRNSTPLLGQAALFSPAAASALGHARGALREAKTRILVDFRNAPRGTRASASTDGGEDPELLMGYSLEGF